MVTYSLGFLWVFSVEVVLFFDLVVGEEEAVVGFELKEAVFGAGEVGCVVEPLLIGVDAEYVLLGDHGLVEDVLVVLG